MLRIMNQNIPNQGQGYTRKRCKSSTPHLKSNEAQIKRKDHLKVQGFVRLCKLVKNLAGSEITGNQRGHL